MSNKKVVGYLCPFCNGTGEPDRELSDEKHCGECAGLGVVGYEPRGYGAPIPVYEDEVDGKGKVRVSGDVEVIQTVSEPLPLPPTSLGEAQKNLALGPTGQDWKYGAIPPVETVPYDRILFFWGPEYVGWISPFGDKLNPLRWCDGTRFPHWGRDNPIGWWTIIQTGSAPRPPDVKTWAEMFPEDSSCPPSL